jgi:hypothetical protein
MEDSGNFDGQFDDYQNNDQIEDCIFPQIDQFVTVNVFSNNEPYFNGHKMTLQWLRENIEELRTVENWGRMKFAILYGVFSTYWKENTLFVHVQKPESIEEFVEFFNLLNLDLENSEIQKEISEALYNVHQPASFFADVGMVSYLFDVMGSNFLKKKFFYKEMYTDEEKPCWPHTFFHWMLQDYKFSGRKDAFFLLFQKFVDCDFDFTIGKDQTEEMLRINDDPIDYGDLPEENIRNFFRIDPLINDVVRNKIG